MGGWGWPANGRYPAVGEGPMGAGAWLLTAVPPGEGKDAEVGEGKEAVVEGTGADSCQTQQYASYIHQCFMHRSLSFSHRSISPHFLH